ncbi:MAG: ATP-dependent DNA ligase [Solirubrobacterales bacterium]|nr:ATP-dependent DNA ligase [Solirubrobacterales bacterium]
MSLPLTPPLDPQLARSAKELPVADHWAYEPKFDGFRAIAFVDGYELTIQSRSGKPLGRYFPEVSFPAGRYVIDGEIVIDGDGDGDGDAQDFGALQQRIHPAESRITMLAEQTPARYVGFDLLALDDDSLLGEPFAARREALERLTGALGIDLTPLTREPDGTEPWLARGEGVVAKDVRAAYRPGERKGMVKVKRVRTIDAVVVGYRPGQEAGTVGSLILGLYDDSGRLRVVGHSSGLRAAEKKALVSRLAPYETGERGYGDPSRWKSEKDLEWIALRPELVVEVTFDHASGGRIRHGTKILRWREDKPPSECALAQMQS